MNGTPGTWEAPLASQNQSLLEAASLNNGPSGIAIAQGTHIGILSGRIRW